MSNSNFLKSLITKRAYHHMPVLPDTLHQNRFWRFRSSINIYIIAHKQIPLIVKYKLSNVFQLYSDIVPLTCENFLHLCESPKAGYAGTPVHRIVKDGWIQCGGFGLKDNPELNCENFIVHHDRRGVLCMANADR